MKKNIAFAFSLLLGTLAFTSCEKSLYDESKQPQDNKTVADLEVPSNFDWKMVKDAKCIIAAGQSSVISIYSDKACKENQMLSTLTTFDGTTTIPLSLPTYTKEIYVQYETTEGKKEVVSTPVGENGIANFTLPENSKPVALTRATAATRGRGSVNYPNDGWGTVMFEDMFPLLGDYDFNDFVLGYRVQIPFISSNEGTFIDAIQLGIELRAMGGILPYSPFLRLKNLKAENVEEIEVYQQFNTPVESVNWSAGPNGEVIIDISNLVAETVYPDGSSYFNTEKTHTVDSLPQLNIAIYVNEGVSIDVVTFDSFDFYLAQNNQGKEIHLGGFEPVYYQYPIGDSNLGDNYYYNEKRLIWGLSVPAPVPHVIEQGNFLKAYKNFANWATSGGSDDSDWYNQGERDNSLLISDQSKN